MIELSGKVGELRLTVGIKRKGSDVVETYELVGALDAADLEKLTEKNDGSNALDSGA